MIPKCLPEKTKDNADTPTQRPYRGIPSSSGEATDVDKLMLDMKDKQDKQWAEFCEKVESVTGIKAKRGSLNVRYRRMKANFDIVEPAHESILLDVKKVTEEQIEADKWQRIANGIEAKSGCKYPPAAVKEIFNGISKRVSA